MIICFNVNGVTIFERAMSRYMVEQARKPVVNCDAYQFGWRGPAKFIRMFM